MDSRLEFKEYVKIVSTHAIALCFKTTAVSIAEGEAGKDPSQVHFLGKLYSKYLTSPPNMMFRTFVTPNFLLSPPMVCGSDESPKYHVWGWC